MKQLSMNTHRMPQTERRGMVECGFTEVLSLGEADCLQCKGAKNDVKRKEPH